jgi:hypothetical protein
MTRLILTADSSSAGCVVSAGVADLAVGIELRMVWGPPRSDAELAAFLEAGTMHGADSSWLYSLPQHRRQLSGFENLGLIELASVAKRSSSGWKRSRMLNWC